jgi:hypothetical protein
VNSYRAYWEYGRRSRAGNAAESRIAVEDSENRSSEKCLRRRDMTGDMHRGVRGNLNVVVQGVAPTVLPPAPKCVLPT